MAALAPMAALPLSGRARATMSSRSIAQPVPVSTLRAKARKATIGVRAASGAAGSIREQAGRRGKSWKNAHLVSSFSRIIRSPRFRSCLATLLAPATRKTLQSLFPLGTALSRRKYNGAVRLFIISINNSTSPP